jgi:FG-GAP repeat
MTEAAWTLPWRLLGALRHTAVERVDPVRLVVVMSTAVLGVSLQQPVARTQPIGSPPWAEFGVSVAAASETIFVAATPMRNGKRGPGTVHVFQHRSAGWVRTDVLSASEMAVEDPFGVSMAADGGTLVVGAQYADARGADSGQAYVFERDNGRWHQAAMLSASDAVAGDQFGLTVSVSGGTIAVGARLADSRAADAGAAYVFTRHNGSWQQVRKLIASDAAAGDIFGRVSIDRDVMVVTADLNDNRGHNAGKAYAFQNRGGAWVEVAQMTANDGTAGDEFGISLALTDGTAVFGAIGSKGRGEHSGAAYVFERRSSGWVQVARLTANDGATADEFGWSVAGDSDTIVVGAPNHNGAGTRAGAAYVFERRAGVWTQAAKLTASDAAPITSFGSTVAISRNTIVVGMRLNGAGKRSGAAYVFERGDGGWSEVARLVPEAAASQ